MTWDQPNSIDMTRLAARLPPEACAFRTRSVRLAGHSTSIRLEEAFWTMLEDLAAGEGLSLGRFLTRLHGETLRRSGEPKNFASLLRCACLIHARERTGESAEWGAR